MVEYLDVIPAARERIVAALSELFDDSCERRVEQRTPYFGPVAVALPDSPEIRLSAFIRDLSPSGIGLVHLMPLRRGEVLIDLPLPVGACVKLRAAILWCRDYDDGWYASGGRFLDVLA